MDIRLNKFLSQRGAASRRKADVLIQQGRVAVNGRVVTDLGVRVDAGRDRVTVDHRPVAPRADAVTIALNKPAGIIVTLDDPFGRPAVRDLTPGLPGNVRPVGRLDKDSSGLLLLTNDGELAFRLTHPRYEIPKTYIVRVGGAVTEKDVLRLEKGVWVEGRKTAPAKVHRLKVFPGQTVVRVEIHEGWKREIRKMFSVLGHDVLGLERVNFAGIKLDRLPAGHWRILKKTEVRDLRRSVGLP
jgi:23S rRNA pseudouridine2605 synthase